MITMLFNLLLVLTFFQRGISQLPDWNSELEVSGKISSLRYNRLVLYWGNSRSSRMYLQIRLLCINLFLLQVRQNGLPSRSSQMTRTGRAQRLFVLEAVRRVTRKWGETAVGTPAAAGSAISLCAEVCFHQQVQTEVLILNHKSSSPPCVHQWTVDGLLWTTTECCMAMTGGWALWSGTPVALASCWWETQPACASRTVSGPPNPAACVSPHWPYDQKLKSLHPL